MQLLDDFQVGHQRSQLGGGTQIELGALVDVERLVEVVGQDPKLGALGRQFVKRKTVDDLARIGLAQHMARRRARRRAPYAGFLRSRRISVTFFCRYPVERALHGKVQAVQFIQAGQPKEGSQVYAHGTGRLAGQEIPGFFRNRRRKKLERHLQGGVPDRGRNHAGLRQHPQMAVGQLLKGLALFRQVSRWPALGDHEAQHVLVDTGEFAEVGSARRQGPQRPIDVIEVPPIPGPQPVADAIHLPESGHRGKRNRVEVVHHDTLARRQRILSHPGRRARKRMRSAAACRRR